MNQNKKVILCVVQSQSIVVDGSEDEIESVGDNRGNNTSQYVENDIAIIIVDDDPLLDSQKINPACLPSVATHPANNQSAIHSGWSYPPSPSYVSKYVEPYSTLIRDFQKQWHYSMILQECRDPRRVEKEGEKYLPLKSATVLFKYLKCL